VKLRGVLDSAKRHWPLVLFPVLKVLIHLVTYRGYGIFRDELYYIMCGQRLAWGYVDHPPLSLLVLRVVQEVLGESLFALRLVPALAGAATVLLAGLMTRALGGGRISQVIAMVCTMAAPVYLALNHFYSMNALSLLLWALAGYLVIRIAEQTSPRLWIILGLVLGLGLLNKLGVLWLGLGLAVGIILTPLRRQLLSPWPWLAALLAMVLFSPHLMWQMANDWPTVEFIRNATGLKMAPVAPWQFLWSQVDMMGLATAPIWLAGLVWLLVGRGGAQQRSLAWIYLVVLGLLIAMGTSRPGYLAPAYTWLLASGGVAVETLVTRLARPWLAWVVVAVVGLYGLMTAPFALPLLPVPSYVEYARKLGVEPSTAERKELAELPQFYADMHGWQELTAAVEDV
jgi:4-amino-4-deoxy-L-arabinose transferase-like glycosyltransferase